MLKSWNRPIVAMAMAMMEHDGHDNPPATSNYSEKTLASILLLQEGSRDILLLDEGVLCKKAFFECAICAIRQLTEDQCRANAYLVFVLIRVS